MKQEKKLLVLVVFNLSLMCLETAGEILSRSLSLLSDAGHMLTDSIAIFLSYFAIRFSSRPANENKTFGYHRIEIIIALINGVILFIMSLYIFYEAVQRFFHPVPIKTGIMMVIAIIGLLGNIFGILLLSSDSGGNMNIKGAFLHLWSDALSSVGVVAGALIIILTGWKPVDSFIGIMIGVLVIRGATGLIMEAGEVLMEALPKDIDLNELKKQVEGIKGVREFHEIHIWSITSDKRALSGHVLIDNIRIAESNKIVCDIKELLVKKYRITHSTLETECDKCSGNACEYSS